MKYKFDVMVALTYVDIDIEVEVELSDKEIERIKKMVAEYEQTKEDESADEEDYVPETSLLLILEDGAPDLFDKFWAVIYKPVFVELLINGLENYGNDIRRNDDNFADYRKASFEELYDMYGDDIYIEHSSCCICRIPEEWKTIKRLI